MQFFCTGNPATLMNSIFFTSAGEPTARPGLPRLTGSSGPGTPSVPTDGSAVTVWATETATSGPSAGVIAGSVVGGAAFGALATLLATCLTWRLRRKKARSTGMAQNDNFAPGVVGPGGYAMDENPQSPYDTGWIASDRHELQVPKVQGQARQELAAIPD